MNIETYKQMRMWENIAYLIKEAESELQQYHNGVKEIINPDIYSLKVETLDDRIESLDKQILIWKAKKKEISETLIDNNIDVEFIVTNIYPELKCGKWFHNYYIEKNKVESSDEYVYITYEQERSKEFQRQTYPSLEAALKEIDSYYYYLKERESLEQVLEEMKRHFE